MKEKIARIQAIAVAKPVLSALALALTVFFFAPSILYFTNAFEFIFSYSQVAFSLLGFALLIALSILAVLGLARFFNVELYKALLALVLALGFLFWVQGNFLLKGLSRLDGTEAVNLMSKTSIFGSVLWAVVIIAALIFRKKIFNFSTHAAVILILVQATGFGLEAWSRHDYLRAGEPEDLKTYQQNFTEDFFTFSNEKNVLLIVLDSFAQDWFLEVIENDEIRKIFDDFVYFSDYSASYPNTSESATALLTGKYYLDRSANFSAFLQETHTSDTSIPVKLKKAGFSGKLLTYAPFFYYMSPELYDNMVRTQGSTPYLTSLWQAAFFRYFPAALKKYSFEIAYGNRKANDNSVCPTNVDFLRKLANSNVTADAKSPAFFIVHLQGAHPTYRHDEFGKPKDDATYVDQARLACRTVNELFKKMKAMDVFDNTTIVITSDHGDPHRRKLAGQAHMLGMIKQAGRRGEALKADDTPLSNIQLTDILDHAMTASELDLGQFINDERVFYTYYHIVGNRIGQNKAFASAFEKYKIKGHAGLENSYIRDEKGTLLNHALFLKANSGLLFPKDYKASAFWGLWNTDKNGIYPVRSEHLQGINAGKEFSGLFAFVPQIETDFALVTLHMHALDPDQKKTSISVNNSVYFPQKGNSSFTQTFYAKNGKEVLVALPEGIKLTKIECTEAGNSLVGMLLVKEEPLTPYAVSLLLKDGWYRAEREGIWTAEPRAALSLDIENSGKNKIMYLSLFTFLGETERRPLIITANGKTVDSCELALPNSSIIRRVSLPADLLGEGKVEIGIETPLVTLRDYLPESLDTRLLGVFLRWLKVEDIPTLEQGLPIETNMESSLALYACAQGWNTPEAAGTWSSAPHARLTLPLAEKPKEDLLVTLDFGMLSYPEIVNHFKLSVAGEKLFEETFPAGTGGREVTIRYPARHIAGDEPVLHIDIESSVHKHSEINPETKDARTLGMFLRWLKVEDVPTLEQGLPIKTNMESSLARYACAQGWNNPEAAGTWTSAPNARLTLPLAEKPKEDLLVTLDFGMLSYPEIVNHLKLSVSGEKLFEETFPAGTGGREVTIRYPARHIAGDEPVLHIDIESSVHKHSEINPETKDARTLGMFLRTVLADNAP